MIAESDVEVLRASVAGPVLTADERDYAAEAQCYNLATVHEPDVIVGATSAADVAATVTWAAECGLPLRSRPPATARPNG